MKKSIIALSIAGISGAALAQSNVTIYGVADVSGQGFSQSRIKAGDASANGYNGGNTFNLQSNSSLIGFKGTEDLGNGLKALFQAETTINLTGQQNSSSSTSGGSGGTSLNGVAAGSGNSVFGALRDTYVGLDGKYGSGLAGYISTPFRSSLTSFDVMPGATGSSDISKQMGSIRLGAASGGDQFSSAIRATSLVYSMPTMYGINGSISYSGSNNNGTNNQTDLTNCTNSTSACTATPQSVFGFGLGWTGYGVNVKGAFQQANNNFSSSEPTKSSYGNYTSYLLGASYTGVPGLKVAAVYARNTLGTNGTVSYGAGNTLTNGAGKLSNNQLWAGASYRMGNWEPRVSASWTSDVNGSDYQQLGSRQWTANLGYYLSKRTQVYGLVSNLNNSANQTYTFGQQTSNLGTSAGTSGSNLFTYGAGLRTTF